MVKFGWNPPTFGRPSNTASRSRRPARRRRRPPADAPESKPAATSRTNAGNRRAPKRQLSAYPHARHGDRDRHRCRHDRRALASPSTRQGRSAGWSYREFTQHFPRPGWVEHDADRDLGRGARRRWASCAARSTSRSPPSASPTSARRWWRGAGARAARCTGRSCGRTAAPPARCDELAAAGHLPLVRERTGLVLDPYFSGTKVAWLLTEGGVPASPDLAVGTDRHLGAVEPDRRGGARHRPVQRQPDDALRHPRAGVGRRAGRPARRARRRAARGAAVERSPRRHRRRLRRPGGHPGELARRRPAGGPVRPGVLRARDVEEHLRHRVVRAHQRRARCPRRSPTAC